MPRKWPWDVMNDFMRALQKLPDTPAVAAAVISLINHIVQDPKRARPNANGVRVLKQPTHQRDSERVPSLRAAYIMVENRAVAPNHPSREMVMFVDITTYTETDDLATVISERTRTH